MNADAEILQDITDGIRADPLLHYARVDVHILDGIATISGNVRSLAERKAVERAAKRVAGIKTLLLKIRQGEVPATLADIDAQSQKDTARKGLG